MTKIYFHIGAHKTGTTSIQYTLDQLSAKLRRMGTLYPKAARYHYAQHRLAFALTGMKDPTQQDRPDLETEARSLIAEIRRSKCRSAVISSEVFFAASDEAIENLKKIFADFDVRIVGYIRRPDHMFESTYNQKTKEPKNKFFRPYRTFLRHPEKLAPDIGYLSILRRWENFFGKEAMIVRTYETPDLMKDFAEACELPHHIFEAGDQKKLNTGVSQPALELVRLAKAAKQDPALVRHLYDLATSFFPLSENESMLTPDERIKLVGYFEDSNVQVFDRYIGTPCIYTVERLKKEDLPKPHRLTLAKQNEFLCHILTAGRPQ